MNKYIIYGAIAAVALVILKPDVLESLGGGGSGGGGKSGTVIGGVAGIADGSTPTTKKDVSNATATYDPPADNSYTPTSFTPSYNTVGVKQTPFGFNEQPLEFTGKYIGERPLFEGGKKGHTNVEATSLPEKYWIDAGSKGVTLVSKIPEQKNKQAAPTGTSAGALFNNITSSFGAQKKQAAANPKPVTATKRLGTGYSRYGKSTSSY